MKPTSKSSDLVLVVDDSPETLGMLNDTLESQGMTTLVALEGKQALSIARKMIPDIILLDAVMPQMDGFEVCKRLKADVELRGIPVVFMTGLSDTEHIVKGFQSGGVDYVTKPIVNEELIARMRVHLANARITLGAQTALDNAGRSLFAVTSSGEISWITPSAHATLALAGDNDDWLQQEFNRIIFRWMDHRPIIGNKLPVVTLRKSFKLVYLGQSRDDEHLVQLVNSNESSEASILKNRLPLTEREAEVLLWIAKGKTNREIGQILETSPRTINKHLEQIYKKLGVENRTAAAIKALTSLNS